MDLWCEALAARMDGEIVGVRSQGLDCGHHSNGRPARALN